ncbi:MAG: phosphate/phosphite/phosphonate ABC transporter substrate-binding protein [Lachnospirales bacterium]
MNTIKVGAVIYDPKVTVIWDIISKFFSSEGCPIECVFYEDYEKQVDGLMNKEIDIAWNSPLAWLDTYLRTKGTCQIASMRDTDRDRHSCFLVKKSSNITSISDLKGKTIGFGAYDSPQARLIPINHLNNKGLAFEKDYVEKRFDIGVGLHGDHVGGELDALVALQNNDVDASICLDLNFEAWTSNGTLDPKEIICIEVTPNFDHCVFCALSDFSTEKLEEWDKVLNRMDYSNKDHKEMMDMEGLKKWVSGRIEGFEQIQEANKLLGFFKYD